MRRLGRASGALGLAIVMTSALTTGSASARPSARVGRTRVALRVVEQYVEAFNNGDAKLAAAQFSRDATLTTPVGGCTPCVGRDTIEQKLAGAISSQAHLSIRAPRVTRDQVTVKSTLRSPQFPPEVTRAIGTFSATVRHRRIVTATQTYARNDPQTEALLAAVGA